MFSRYIVFILFFALNLNVMIALASDDVLQKVEIGDTPTLSMESKSPDFSREFAGKDRLQGFNRAMFTVNSKLNKYILRPVNIVWASIMPKYGVERLDSLFNNIGYPVRLMGSLCQGDLKASGTETVRFLTNSTIGIAGLYDPAKNWYHINPREEDMGQALAHHGVGAGAYLYLPLLGPTNMRDGFGSLLEMPFNPSMYFGGPIIASANGARAINSTTGLQQIIKTVENTYIDPYEITKQFYGIGRYSRIKNLDRKDTFNKLDATLSSKHDFAVDSSLISKVEADIVLDGYNAQGPAIDSLRSTFFDKKGEEKSAWLELSLWNKTFKKRLKKSSIKIGHKCPKYNYKYILQNDADSSSLAILYPSVGEDIDSKQSTAMAKILYDKGYSVAIMGSPFQWQFVRSMPDKYAPGFSPSDAYYLRLATSKVIKNLESKKHASFSHKVVVGVSWGALNSVFIADQEQKNDVLGISRYVAINPPIDVLHAIYKVDGYISDWKKHNVDVKLKSAITVGKINRLLMRKDVRHNSPIHIRPDEAKFAIGFTMKQKLSDVILAVENDSKLSDKELYKQILAMDFSDYMKKYIFNSQERSVDELNYSASLYSLEDFLKKTSKLKILHTADDYLVNANQLKWLKNTMGSNLTIFSNGSHLGHLYRKEFQNTLIKEVSIQQQSL